MRVQPGPQLLRERRPRPGVVPLEDGIAAVLGGFNDTRKAPSPHGDGVGAGHAGITEQLDGTGGVLGVLIAAGIRGIAWATRRARRTE